MPAAAPEAQKAVGAMLMLMLAKLMHLHGQKLNHHVVDCYCGVHS